MKYLFPLMIITLFVLFLAPVATDIVSGFTLDLAGSVSQTLKGMNP
jgi:uncharacterized protein involved in cysteine biosynthesis